ncbi:MAG TPA: YvcK family protein [Pseudogracilibacillus sp.]|nr:YvcK family protein [Pseudogracilibacillus sp.]
MGKNEEPKVVVLGGGTGMPVLLEGLKKYPIHLSTVVTVADDGGSTGKIKEEMDIPAPGDIRNVIVALSTADEELNGLFQHRFDEGETLSGHAVGNLVLAAMKSLTGDFYEAVEKVADMFKVKGDIFPIVNESVVLHAEMTDGTIVSGESNIPHEHKIINRIFLTPENIEPNPKVVQAIHEADLVIISPGSLYTSILPNLILGGVVKALHQTNAKIAYVCNVMTQHGETDGYSASDHVKAIDSHIGKGVLDTIILHDDIIDPEVLQLYKEEQATPVPFDENALRELDIEVMQADIVDYSGQMIRHNTKRITDILYKMACEESKK